MKVNCSGGCGRVAELPGATELSQFICSRCVAPAEEGSSFQKFAFDPFLDKRRSGRDLIAMNAAAGNIRFERLSKTVGSGFQIITPRREEREIPEWARMKAGIQKILLTAFPRLHTSLSQRTRAGRWAQVINLYFVKGWPVSEVADELNESITVIKTLTRSITRTSQGLRTDGSGPRSK